MKPHSNTRQEQKKVIDGQPSQRGQKAPGGGKRGRDTYNEGVYGNGPPRTGADTTAALL